AFGFPSRVIRATHHPSCVIGRFRWASAYRGEHETNRVHLRATPIRRRHIVAVTTFGTNHPMAVKLWSKRLSVEVLQETYAMRFTGKSQSAMIEIKDEATKGPGDKITFALRMQMVQDGILGDET